MTEHSKEVMERRRQGFEAAFLKKYGFGRLTAASNPDSHTIYEAALWAWNAALDNESRKTIHQPTRLKDSCLICGSSVGHGALACPTAIPKSTYNPCS